MWAVVFAFLALPPEVPLGTIEKHISEGRFREALELLAGCEASAPCRVLASKAHDGLGDPSRAVEEAEAALAIDPRLEAAHLQLGQIFLGNHTPQAAFEVFSEALAIHPNSLFLLLGRGLALKELGRYEEAERDLAACLERKRDLGLAFDALATVYLHSKRFEELIRLAADFRSRAPADYRGPYFAAAAIEGGKDSPEEAARLAREAIRLNPGFAAAHALLGKTLLEIRETGAAIDALERALALRPGYTPAAFHLAQAYRRAGREADAAKMLERLRALQEQESRPRPALRYHRGKR